MSRSQRRKAACKMRNDGPKLPARPTALGTVLFRTKVSSTAFGKQKSDATTKQLTQLPGVIDVRVNARERCVNVRVDHNQRMRHGGEPLGASVEQYGRRSGRRRDSESVNQ